MKLDELMVAAVMIVSAISILILIASHSKVTGKAVATPENIQNAIHNAETTIWNGELRSCNDVCSDTDKICILATKNSKLGRCTTRSTGITCVCAQQVN